MMYRARRIVKNLFEIGDDSSEVRDELAQSLGDFCPKNKDLFQGLDLEEISEQAIDALTLFTDFVDDRLGSVDEMLNSTDRTNEQIDSIVKQIDGNSYFSLAILVPWVLVPSFMLVGVIMAHCRVRIAFYDCLLQWFFLPVLIFLTVASATFSAALSIIAIANAGTFKEHLILHNLYYRLFLMLTSLRRFLFWWRRRYT